MNLRSLRARRADSRGRERVSRDCRRAAHAAQRVVRPDARAVARHQRTLHRRLQGEDRVDVDDQAVARRLEHAGARGHRRTGGRRGHARVVHRHRTRSAKARTDQVRHGSIGCPNRSLPYTSTIVFVVRKGNPRKIKDWPDLVKPGVEIVTPNPKTSGNGYLTFFSAWGSVVLRGGSEDAGQGVPRRALQARAGARLGRARCDDDVRAEAHRRRAPRVGERSASRSAGSKGRARDRLSADQHPGRTARRGRGRHCRSREGTSRGRRGVPEVSVHRRGPEDHRRSTSTGRAIPRFCEAHAANFPAIELFPITKIAPGWDDAQKRFTGDGGVFDTFYKPGQ